MYLFLLIIITIFSSLYGMENPTKNELTKKIISKAHQLINNKIYNSENITKYGSLINFAERTKTGHLLARLMHICLPPEIVQIYISPHFSKSIATMHKYGLLNYKHLQANCINHNNNTWSPVIQHDGNYSVAPKINQKYIIWQEHCISRRNYYPDNNKIYTTKLMSHKDEKSTRFKLVSLDTDNPDEKNQQFILRTESKNGTIKNSLTTSWPVSHALFSNDSRLIAFGFSENINRNYINIHNLKTFQNLGSPLNGSISALCAAHHNPLFAIGSNKPNTPMLTNLFIFTIKNGLKQLDGDNAPITWLEFSPNDKQLLACSYNQEKNISKIILYNTSIIDQIKLIKTHNYEQYHIHKAFFICNGKKIIIINNNGEFGLLNQSNGTITNISSPKTTNQEKIPLIIWSNKHKLIISALGKTILFQCAKKNDWLNSVHTSDTIAGIGLTADETTVIFTDKHEKVHALPLYNAEDWKEINFIEKQASIVNLYEMFTIYKKSKHSFKQIQLYIQKQQKNASKQ